MQQLSYYIRFFDTTFRMTGSGGTRRFWYYILKNKVIVVLNFEPLDNSGRTFFVDGYKVFIQGYLIFDVELHLPQNFTEKLKFATVHTQQKIILLKFWQ